MDRVLAVDLGGTTPTMAFVDERGRIEGLTRTERLRTPEEAASAIAAMARQGEPIGLIVPGIYESRTGTAWAPGLWGWDPVPLCEQLEKQLGDRVAIASDRAGCMLGEQWMGGAKGLSDALFVLVGSGIGVGILSNGRVVRGAHGSAGAAGWMSLTREWNDEYARCGCWEFEASATAVARRAGMETIEEVIQAARSGNSQVVQVLCGAAKWLGSGIANLISVFDPEVVILGGVLVRAGDLVLDTICAEVKRWAQPVAAKLTRVELSALGESAGLLGAARLAFIKHS